MNLLSVVHAAVLPCVSPGGGGGGCAVPIFGFNTLFSNILGVIVGLAAIVFFIMLIVGGYKFITSGGNPKAAESAKHTLTYAILGLLLVASAFLILELVEQFTGASVTEFNVIGP